MRSSPWKSPLALVLALAPLLPSSSAAAPAARHKVDTEAMREAVEASRPGSPTAPGDEYSPAASYSHFLRARMAHHEGNARAALESLRQALATDEGNPYLTTALAEQHNRLGELSLAERLLKNVLAAHPQYYRAHLLMGRVLIELKKPARAWVNLRRAAQIKPAEPEPALLLAQLSLDTGAVDDAVRFVEAQAKAAPQDGFALRRLATVLLERGELDRAKRLLDRAVERDPGDVEALLLSAQVAEGSGKAEAALAFYERALVRDADHRESLLGAGRLALQRSDYPLARAYFDRLLRLADDPELAMRVAFLFLGAEREEEAGAVLETAKGMGPANGRLAFYRGLLHERRGNFTRAAAAYAEVPRAAELYATARMRRAMALLQGGQPRDALVPLKEAITDRPEDWEAYPVYARALELTGDPAGGEKLLRDALKKAPGASDLHEGLSELLLRRGRVNEALALLTSALKERPKDEQLLFALAVVLERQGKVDDAVAQMREVIALNPEHAAAMNFIGYSLAERGTAFDEAERLIQRALQIRPETGAFLDSLGWVYYRRGQYDRALTTLEHAVSVSPYEPVIIEHLGDTYEKLSKHSEATATYRRALQSLDHAPLLDDAERHRRSLERKLKLLLSTEAAAR